MKTKKFGVGDKVKNTPLLQHDVNRTDYGSSKYMRNGRKPLLSFKDRR